MSRLGTTDTGEVRFDAGTRGAHAHDGSNYRQPPTGTSLAGQCCNEAMVIDGSMRGDRTRAVAQVRCRRHAGNFGFERGHYDVSAACAKRGLCAGRLALHLAQLLDHLQNNSRHLQNNLPSNLPNVRHGDSRW